MDSLKINTLFDFTILASKNLDGRGGHNRKDYHLSLDMANKMVCVRIEDHIFCGEKR